MYVVEMVNESTLQTEYILGIYSDNQHAEYAGWVEEAIAPPNLCPRVSWFELDYIDPIKQDAFEEFISDG
jgi:hypothetical protein